MSTAEATKFPCPCCGYLTLSEAERGSYEICPVCLWEDDASQLEDPESDTGANSVSLAEARRNFAEYGASEERFARQVRPPQDDEIPAEDNS